MSRKSQARNRGSFLELKWEYKGKRHPIRYYREKELETHIVCNNCSLEYAVYGVFAYCPDCRTHNSIQILTKNLELARKELTMAIVQDDNELSNYLIYDALENAVSAFDGFGRETCQVNARLATNPDMAERLSFQNLKRASERVEQLFGFILSAGLDNNTWLFAYTCFQKRHLLAHKMGVVDQKYIDDTNDLQAIVGRKIQISNEEVQKFIEVIEALGVYLVTELSKLDSQL